MFQIEQIKRSVKQGFNPVKLIFFLKSNVLFFPILKYCVTTLQKVLSLTGLHANAIFAIEAAFVNY